MKWTVGAKIGSGFALALIALTTLGAVTHRNTQVLVRTMHAVEQELKTQHKLEDVTSSLNAAVAAQRGYLFTGREQYLQRFETERTSTDTKIREVQESQMQADERRQLESVSVRIGSFLEGLAAVVAVRRDEGPEAALRRHETERSEEALRDIHAAIGGIETAQDGTRTAMEQAADGGARLAMNCILFGILACFLVLGTAGFLITRDIARPLRLITVTAERVAAGDLTVDVGANGRRDEVGTLAHTLARMVENLRGSHHKIQEAVGVLSSSASEIVAAVTQVTSGATETAAAVSETATTVEEVKQTAQVSNQKAKQVADGAQRSVQASQAGEKSVHETIDGMNRIREQMESIATSIVRLSEQSQAIGEIIATVNDLAEQSNLLAVNASIEAARAGEQGKGFAVVAQEVKVLAEESKQATAQVRTILSDIQKATGAAVMAIEQGGKAVEAGAKQSTETGDSIQVLAKNVVEAAQALVQIEASSRQQLLGMDQVAVAMDNIKLASVQNVASMNQVESAAKNLHELGQTLRQMVQHYKV